MRREGSTRFLSAWGCSRRSGSLGVRSSHSIRLPWSRRRSSAKRALDRPRRTHSELLSWNIGYASLGHESDFIVDGGRQLRAQSRSIVDRNLEAIIHRLRAEKPDVLLLQGFSR